MELFIPLKIINIEVINLLVSKDRLFIYEKVVYNVVSAKYANISLD